MKYLVIDDEHELYDSMFADLYTEEAKAQYDIEEIGRMRMPGVLRPLYKLHFNPRINGHLNLPLRSLWNPCYCLHQYPFRADEEYCVLFLNGTLALHFDEAYLRAFKEAHPNVRLALIMYDSLINPSAARSVSMIPLFDVVFSFDEGDCAAHGFERIWSTFSVPKNLQKEETLRSSAFFVGFGVGRLKLLQDSFERITRDVPECRFMIAGVHAQDRREIPGVIYNETIPYEMEMRMAYNTNCVVEIVKEGQKGVSLRTCEAIAFGKRLLTNNRALENMPFYDPRFMQIFDKPEEIDTDFITRDMDVRYAQSDCFSPLAIIRRLEERRKEYA